MVRSLLLLLLAVACSDGDAGPPDGPANDASSADDAASSDADPRRRLSETGLYADFDAKEIAASLSFFQPTHVLWSDGAHKRRWIDLPACSTIDASDMDRWRFPVGTRFFKEFAAPDGRLLETRLIEHVADTGDDDVDYWMGAFVWEPDGSEATFAVDGAENVNGTEHDVPSAKRCRTCHNGEPGKGLGFSAVQLSGPGEGLRLGDVAPRLSATPDPSGYAVPGDALGAQALGYLHANCGHCHNPYGSARPDVDLEMRVRAGDQTPQATATWQTAVAVPLFRFDDAEGITDRIVPGDPERSGVVYRMRRRGDLSQMPPIATEKVDPEGVRWVWEWIEGLGRP